MTARLWTGSHEPPRSPGPDSRVSRLQPDVDAHVSASLLAADSDHTTNCVGAGTRSIPAAGGTGLT